MERKSKRSNRLGKGLSALIPETFEEINHKDILNIEIKNIHPNDLQPRKYFDDEKIKALSESIKNHGVLQPIVLKPDGIDSYMIIAGERRYRASKMAGIKEIPAIVKDIPMKNVMEIALIENIQREDLNAVEEALAYKSLIENYEVTQEEIADAVGKSRSYITNTLRLLNLSKKVIELLDSGEITAGHGKAILRIPTEQQQYEIALRVVEEGLSVRQVEDIAKKIAEGKEIEAPKKEKEEEKDIFLVDIEDKLTNTLGTKVSIKKGKRKGKIEIEYYNDEDLNNIIAMIME
ncbi:MAG: ParB/RepB/Spo0J family partition protein [Clostridioides sp.]|jgi:ParB family chromosome partitioning protein|nr:ParB/RepB/Spo0J family partition protein [Clostridioides sp.]